MLAWSWETIGIRVLLYGDDLPILTFPYSAYAMLQWACASIGAILVTVNPAYRIHELVRYFEVSTRLGALTFLFADCDYPPGWCQPSFPRPTDPHFLLLDATCRSASLTAKVLSWRNSRRGLARHEAPCCHRQHPSAEEVP